VKGWLIPMIGLLLAACRAPAPAVQLPSASPSSLAPVTPAPTWTSTVLPSPTATQPFVPLRSTPTEADVENARVSPPDGQVTLEPGEPPTERIVTETSPDQKWRTVLIRRYLDDWKVQLTFQVINLENQSTWTVEDQVLDGNSQSEYPVPIHWSQDGEHLYVTHRLSQLDGCFPPGPQHGIGLLRLDLQSLTVDHLFEEFTSEMVISPDGTTLAYLRYGDQGIGLIDLETKKQTILDLAIKRPEPTHNINQMDIVWAPDSSALVYAILKNYCLAGPFGTTIVKVRLNPLYQKVLVAFPDSDQENYFHPGQWTTDRGILLEGDVKAEEKMWLDPQTGVLTPITP
jgi:hypothetical protein